MWPFGEKAAETINPWTIREEWGREVERIVKAQKEREAMMEENKANNFWLYWHAHTATVIDGPFCGYWGVVQATDSSCQAVSLAMAGRKDPIWFKVARLVRQDW